MVLVKKLCWNDGKCQGMITCECYNSEGRNTFLDAMIEAKVKLGMLLEGLTDRLNGKNNYRAIFERSCSAEEFGSIFDEAVKLGWS